MAAATAVNAVNWSTQFQSLFSDVWTVTATLDVGSLADGAGETETVAVPGVKLGDMVLGVSFGVDLVDMVVTAYVQAAGAVEIRVQNESGAAPNLASTTIKLLIARPRW